MEAKQSTGSAHLRILVAGLSERAGATCGVLFATRESGPVLADRFEVDQTALSIVYSAWARRRHELQAGAILRYGTAVIWPLFDGPQLVALVYLDRVAATFPDDGARHLADDIRDRLRGLTTTTLSSYLAVGVNALEAGLEVQRDHLMMALDFHHYNVAAVALLFGVARDTIYRRADRLGIDILEERRRHAGRRRTARRLPPTGAPQTS